MGSAAETAIRMLGMYRQQQGDQTPTIDELADVLREAVARDPDLADLFNEHLPTFDNP